MQPSKANPQPVSAPDPIREQFFSSGQAAPVLDRRSAQVDSLVLRAWMSELQPAFPEGLAVLGVGGYGRRELFPHSDVDLLLLSEEPLPAGSRKEALSRFLQVLWDAGLRVSHSVRTVKDCCELHNGNTELTISLLDQRYLAGDMGLYEALAARFPKFIQGQRQTLLRHLCRMTRERHRHYQETIHHLEPNVKEHPGGLRDLHALGWLGKLRNESWKATPAWIEELKTQRRFVYSVRCFLHYRCGRDNNLLTFDYQEEIVEKIFPGFTAAAWMRDYYRNARSIFATTVRAVELCEGQTSSLLANFRDWRSRLSNADFTVSRERVFFKAPQHIERNPELAFRLFEFLGRHRIPPHQDSEKRLRECASLLAEFTRGPQPFWPRFREILTTPNAGFALRWMHETGVLDAIFPEFAEIDCYVVRDFNHRYTVDEHTLIALETLERLREHDDGPRARFRGLLSEVDRLDLVRTALLFHDAGKARQDGIHAETSSAMARQALLRIQAPEKDIELVCFLIDNHLTLSSAMLTRDLDDPRTAVDLAARIGSVERLKALALVTFADVTAVHPGAMSPWRLEQLWRVFVVTYNELTRELDMDRITEPPTPSPEAEAFLKGLPTRYLRTHSQKEIQRHLELNQLRRNRGAAIEIERSGGVYRLTALTTDRLFLFASLAGAISAAGMNILKAEAFANQQGTVVDTFVFADPLRTLELNPPELDRLKRTLEEVALGKVDVKRLLRSRPRPQRPSASSTIESRVSFNNEISDNSTLVEVVTEDRPGLLYDLASAFSDHGCSIDVVLVDTEAHRALDVFYVTAKGKKLSPSHQQALHEALISACNR